MKARDYELLAVALYGAFPNAETWGAQEERVKQHSADCIAVADAFAARSQTFDRQLFLTNCGVTDNGNRQNR